VVRALYRQTVEGAILHLLRAQDGFAEVMTTIRNGSSGPDVARWQAFLAAGERPSTWVNDAGYTRSWPSTWDWPIAADGQFGQRTEWATEALQHRAGLIVDGIVGPQSWALVPGQPLGHSEQLTQPSGDSGELVRPAVRDVFPWFSAKFEGVVPYPYLDILGLVTVAIGNLIDPEESALSLPFVRLDGSPASRAEISSAWHALKRCDCGKHDASLKCAWPNKRAPQDMRPCLSHMGHLAAKHMTSIRLTEDGVERLVHSKMNSMARHLAKRFPNWRNMPADAQLATLSVAWACGEAFRFHRLEAALLAGDYATAADECKIGEAGNPGVAPRNVANKALFQSASKVAAGGGDPDVVHV
jgi:GH24 family phage-related lysozyme (muramidase)